MILGAIGDDFTGSSDLGLMLAEGGMRTVQYVGVPDGPADPAVDAGIVALKSRSIPVADAVRQSLEALAWLKAAGCRQFLFKICSTFDSTPEGNIGPVAEALIAALGTTDPVVVCPVFPATGRTLYLGHLFVGDALLSQSGLEHHPINPMTDPDIRRWLDRQTEGDVGHVSLPQVRGGAATCRAALVAARDAGRQLAIVDAIDDSDLTVIADAAEDFPFIVGGSGVALGLPDVYRRAGLIGRSDGNWQGASGKAVALSGSCSRATRAQIAEHAKVGPQKKIDTDAVMSGELTAAALADWAMAADGLPLVYSSDDPATVKAAQEKHGAETLANALETLFGDVAVALAGAGAERLIVAGGETSGAVVTALDLGALEIGPKIDPGVPAVRAGALTLALKSGNFGAPDFFEKAAKVMGS
ncbi:four-carbon acid sugar kinase family protein [Acuticoccus sp. MNP-M23]|uniref:3-oxo-tetronate kinase n=1 Tax=Acuticoccus sp. MNP-M23 TaxID=3072793 RepID=UPI002815084F|nr:3-oxo-tetronate kinase [Acuticoccus sp. MNP-M23]WMS44762.1 four-carbon acid sugar kinase family protein [Acuticoccus sp. MNP-M23]